jgi:hypothetical protein
MIGQNHRIVVSYTFDSAGARNIRGDLFKLRSRVCTENLICIDSLT